MRTKVLSVIVIVMFSFGLMTLGFYHLPPRVEIVSFLDYLAVIVYIYYVAGGTVTGCLFVVKWFIK